MLSEPRQWEAGRDTRDGRKRKGDRGRGIEEGREGDGIGRRSGVDRLFRKGGPTLGEGIAATGCLLSVPPCRYARTECVRLAGRLCVRHSWSSCLGKYRG